MQRNFKARGRAESKDFHEKGDGDGLRPPPGGTSPTSPRWRLPRIAPPHLS